MRLIDADALKEKVNNEELTFDGGVDINSLIPHQPSHHKVTLSAEPKQ